MPTDSTPRPMLGEILVKTGLITRADLNDALDEQRQTKQRLGEILIQRGRLGFAMLGWALSHQQPA